MEVQIAGVVVWHEWARLRLPRGALVRAVHMEKRLESIGPRGLQAETRKIVLRNRFASCESALWLGYSILSTDPDLRWTSYRPPLVCLR